jgi:hypothetical protein
LKLDYVSDNYSSLKGVDFKNIEVEVKSKINTASNKSIEILVNVVDINISPRY